MDENADSKDAAGKFPNSRKSRESENERDKRSAATGGLEKHLASISDEATAHRSFLKDYEECVSNVGHLNHN